ncbi:DUF1080 domain-containing protein [Georgenia sp. 311]|nr:DUF1080 domain-containing protein [Georgenia sp. 311]
MGGRSRGLIVAVTCAVVLAGCAAPSTPDRCGGPDPAGDARVLLDGSQESLEGWRTAGPGGFEVGEDCSVRTVGGMGLLWFPEELADYRLTVEWRASGDDNSGVFVGFPDPGDDPWVAVRQGYEIQIDPTDAPDRTTGAVYGFQGADVVARDAALAAPGEWNTLDVVVQDPRITVSLNGAVVTEFVSTDPARDLSSGHVGLQNHGDDDEVHFRSVVLTPLTD